MVRFSKLKCFVFIIYFAIVDFISQLFNWLHSWSCCNSYFLTSKHWTKGAFFFFKLRFIQVKASKNYLLKFWVVLEVVGPSKCQLPTTISWRSRFLPINLLIFSSFFYYLHFVKDECVCNKSLRMQTPWVLVNFPLFEKRSCHT